MRRQTDIFVAQPGATEEPAPESYLPVEGLQFANSGPGNWHWFDMTDDLVHFNEAKLEGAKPGPDGRTAQPQGGLAIRPNEASSDLLIFLEGGNACVSTVGCEVTRNLEGFKGDPWCEMNSYPGQSCTLHAKRPATEKARPLDFDIFADHEDNPFHNWNACAPRAGRTRSGYSSGRPYPREPGRSRTSCCAA